MQPDDLEEMNRIFAEAFTASYHRDGLPAVRIPPLSPAFLALERQVSGEGAFVAEQRGRLTGFVFARAHGSEGWFGPLAVDPSRQRQGIGKALVGRAVDYLKEAGCRTIGLETMPRTYVNLGLYTGLGFRPGHLVMTCQVEIPVQIPKVRGHGGAFLLSQLHDDERRALHPHLVGFWNQLAPGLDYTATVHATLGAGFGDALVVQDKGEVVGFLHFHHSRYFVTDGPGVLRIARVAARRDTNAFPILMAALADYGIDHGMDELYIRCQSSDWEVTQMLLSWGFRITHTDLRMHLDGYPEPPTPEHVHMTRWG